MIVLSVSPDDIQKEGYGGHLPQVHRHLKQVWSWSLPDKEGQNGLYGTSQKGRGKGRVICYLS